MKYFTKLAKKDDDDRMGTGSLVARNMVSSAAPSFR